MLYHAETPITYIKATETVVPKNVTGHITHLVFNPLWNNSPWEKETYNTDLTHPSVII